SHAYAAAAPPLATICSTVSSAPARLRSIAATAAPSCASRNDVARPMPLAAPVTTATRPAKRVCDFSCSLMPRVLARAATSHQMLRGCFGWLDTTCEQKNQENEYDDAAETV